MAGEDRVAEVVGQVEQSIREWGDGNVIGNADLDAEGRERLKQRVKDACANFGLDVSDVQVEGDSVVFTYRVRP